MIPDTDDLDTFHDVFGFRPPAEPLLSPVFTDDAAEPLTAFHEWNIPADMQIVEPDLLATMKVRSIPDRNRDQKRVKDVADLHALLWYVREYGAMRSDVRSWVTESDLDQLRDHVDDGVYAEAADLLQIDTDLVRDSVEQLML